MIHDLEFLCGETVLEGGVALSDGDDSAVTGVSVSEMGAALRDVARLKSIGATQNVLAEAAVAGLAGLVPGAGVAVLSFVPLPHKVQLLAMVDPVPAGRQDRWVSGEDSFVVDCARSPGTVVHSTGGAPGESPLRARAPQQGESATLGIAVAIGASSMWILAVTPPADSTVQDLNETVRCFGGVLRSVLRQEPAPPSQDSVEQAVRRAKQEWELTVDALPHVVCLLDSAGRVLRANRAIERWSLGTVEDARGKHFHDLLHPDCVDPECPVLTGVGLSRKRMQSERRRAYEFQLSDRALQRTVRVRVGRMLGSSEQLQAVSATCAVLVVQDVTALELAKTRLAKLNAELESRVEERTRELADANRELQNEISRCTIAEEQLRQRSAELSQLSASLMNTQEQERKRISRELHDSIGQSLTALKFGLERAVELDRQGSRQAVIEQLQKSIGSVQATMDDVRTVALDLRPSVLDDLGAASAVAWFCRNFSASYPGIKVVISNVTARDNEVPARLATAIFRSLQELLNNVARHSQATRVSVALRREPRRVVLEVGDNGIGLQGPLPEPSARGGHGTRNLRERAEMTGGTFELRSGSPRGVVASISWMLLPGEDSGSDEPAVGEEK